ncbi:MAG: (d)CMP kinase [Chloroflexi bacterium]|nr:(d)CMP kinase [Chloroflexota bacterium]
MGKEKPATIAIDGPAASGKSTIGYLLAKRLGYLYFDTGAMYRALTWAALEQNLDTKDQEAMTELARSVEIEIRPGNAKDGRHYTVLLNGKDVTWAIRRPEVDGQVSVVSAHPGVRQIMSQRQREIGKRGRTVMVGRDIGTVVLPDADLKIYLDASPEVRARRRLMQIESRGEKADSQQILEEMRRRDRIDSQRQLAPLKPAEDAVIVDTDPLTLGQVMEKVIGLAEGWRGK